MAKVLLVEDDNNLREIFAMRLQAEGYEVSTASDGEEALAVAVKQKPDLIVADVMMPRLSGFEMLENLRAAPEMKDTKVVMMTALGQAEDRTRGEKLGVVKYLVKSQVTLEDFVRVVREIIQPNDPKDLNKRSNSMDPNANPPTNDPAAGTGASPSPPPAGDSNPISQPAPGSDTSDAMPVDKEKAAVQDQVDDFAAGAGSPAAAPGSPPGAQPPASPPPAEPPSPPPADPAGDDATKSSGSL